MTTSFESLENDAFNLAKQLEYAPEGRRRSGRTETMWQYVPYEGGSPISAIDWRQSAKGRDILVRKHESLSRRDVYFWSNFTKCEEDRDSTIRLQLALAYLLARKERQIGCICGARPITQSIWRIRQVFEDGLISPLQNRKIKLQNAFLILADNLNQSEDELAHVIADYAQQGHSGLVLHLGGSPLSNDLSLREACRRVGWPVLEMNRNDQVDRCLLHLFEKSMDATR